jgi:hypothetical protein
MDANGSAEDAGGGDSVSPRSIADGGEACGDMPPALALGLCVCTPLQPSVRRLAKRSVPYCDEKVANREIRVWH